MWADLHCRNDLTFDIDMHERLQCHTQRRAEKLGAKLFLLRRWYLRRCRVQDSSHTQHHTIVLLSCGLSFKDGEIFWIKVSPLGFVGC